MISFYNRGHFGSKGARNLLTLISSTSPILYDNLQENDIWVPRTQGKKASRHFIDQGFAALESYFEEHATEVWERDWMNPEMHATLLNAYTPKTDSNDSEGTSSTTQRE